MYKARVRRLRRLQGGLQPDTRPLYRTGHEWDIVLLVQLRNGARIGEAIEAVKEFCESNGRAVSVRVRIEKRKEGDTRLMVLPEELRSSEGRSSWPRPA